MPIVHIAGTIQNNATHHARGASQICFKWLASLRVRPHAVAKCAKGSVPTIMSSHSLLGSASLAKGLELMPLDPCLCLPKRQVNGFATLILVCVRVKTCVHRSRLHMRVHMCSCSLHDKSLCAPKNARRCGWIRRCLS